ncbi:MAG: bifunctional aspartate transaminase/aspartate 4-decarboxylase [Syntrophales bacterium]|nr:bifunctional aspartate transaminase/aspartate 4-decarboxylase [Syntrophales bacterium]
MVKTGFNSYVKLIVAVCLGLLVLQPVSLYAEIRPMSMKERKAYEALSPFEFKNILIETATDACTKELKDGKKCRVLNAGRGNPNFLNTTAREAFSLLNNFATERAEMRGPTPNLGFRPDKKGIARKLKRYLDARSEEKAAKFLRKAIDYAEKELKLEPDELAFELTDAVLGDFYPSPPRMLSNTEKIVFEYLSRIHFTYDKKPEGRFDLFATEGATAAMIYVFQSLKENHILKPGDHIAIITPIFSPYLEIPLLNDFQLVPVYVEGSEDMGWQVPASEMDKLKDTKIKALFMVNPMNPGSASMRAESVSRLAEIIKTSRKNLIVLTDTAYAPFVDEFHDILGKMPENTIGVYSYSKYFGVTGWRLGVIMLHENNIIDRMIAKLPERYKKQLNVRYGIDSTEPEKIKFIDRIVMDSRDVALAHTGGLSTPQQCIMVLFSFFELLDKEHAYKKSIQAILKKRITNLYGQLNLKIPGGPDKTHYYALIDIGRLASSLHGKDFADYMMKNFSPLDVLMRLADKKFTVLLPGEGFAGPKWSICVSIANLYDDDYTSIGKNIREVMDDFFQSWKEKSSK